MSAIRRRTTITGIVVWATLATQVLAGAYQRPGRTERVSISSTGQQSNGAFAIYPSISSNGRYVVFGSDSSTLVPGDTNDTWDIFLRDRAVSLTERISVSSQGTEGNGPSAQGTSGYTASVSADGRFVAFASQATNLVEGDTNSATDVFVRDRVNGTTERVSLANDGTEAAGASNTASISDDGRYVAFTSNASNIVPGDGNGMFDIFVRDRLLRTTLLASKGPSGIGNGVSSLGVLSSNGRHVLFESAASNLVSDDSNISADAFVRNLDTGVIERVSVATDGTQANGTSQIGDISADGSVITFRSDASNLVPSDSNGINGVFSGTDVFVRDRAIGRTERVSIRSNGEEASPGVSLDPRVSDDGRYVVFESEVTDLVPGDTNEALDVLLYDRVMGRMERISVNSVAAQGNSHSLSGSVAAFGRHVAFSSEAGNMVAGDSNGRRDNFVRDRGPDIGVGDLTAAPFDSFLGRKVTGSGWSTFTGSQLAWASDPIDGTAGAAEAGAELTGATVSYRAEEEDLLVRLNVSQLSPVGGVCGKNVPCPVAVGRPGTLYGFELTLANGARFEVRSMRAASTSIPPSTPYFGLYRCEQQGACIEVAKLRGGIGTAGEDVRVAIPISGLGIPEGTALRSLRAFTAVGEASSGPASQMDEIRLGDADVPARSVYLGVAAPGVPSGSVQFTTAASLDKGTFSATLSAPAGAYRLWARACLGGACSATSVLVGGSA